MASQNVRPLRVRRRRRRRWPALLLAGGAVVAAVYVFRVGHVPAGVPDDPEPLSEVRVGTLAVTVDADAVLVRREQVFRAPQSGTVRRLAREGDRVRVGGEVVAFTSGAVGAAAGAPEFGAPGEVSSGGDLTAALPAQASPARQEFERLAAQIYATALALNEAQARGEPTTAYQERLDELAQAQNSLLPALRQEAEWSGAAAGAGAAQGSRGAVGTGAAGGSGEALWPGAVAAPARAGEPDVTVGTGETQVFTTPVSGVVLYQTDGLEEILTPEAVAGWGPKELLNLPYADVAEIAEGPVGRDGALFKLVDDLELEMLLLVPAERLPASIRSELLVSGVEMKVAGRDLPLSATVLRIAEEGGHLLLHLAAPLPSSDALRLRRMRVTLRLAEYEGIILPRSAVDVAGGRTGVWVARRNGYQFVPVRVLGGTDDEVAVEADLSPGTQVLAAPPPPADRRLSEE